MKTNRFLLAVACATMTFTLFACSDDKDDPPTATGKSCYSEASPISGGTGSCSESKTGKPLTQADCGSKATLKEESYPPDPELECEIGDMKSYFYGEAASSVTCSELFNR